MQEMNIVNIKVAQSCSIYTSAIQVVPKRVVVKHPARLGESEEDFSLAVGSVQYFEYKL